MKKSFLLILSLMICIPSIAQTPDTLWTKTFGGSGDEFPCCLQITGDNGCIVLGTTQSFGAGQEDLYLIKTDSTGNEVWSKTYGGLSYDAGSYILSTKDAGYLMMGNTSSFEPGGIWLIKLNSTGDTLWTKLFGNMYWDSGRFLIETSDGGYSIIGSNYSMAIGQVDLWIIKIDSLGNKLWDKIYGGISTDMGASIIQTSDNGYLVLGNTRTSDFADPEIWLIKTNSNGDSLWTKKLGVGLGESIIETSNGNYIIAASHPMFISSQIFEIDSAGNVIWSKMFDTSLDHANSILKCPDNGYLIVGWKSNLIYEQSDLVITRIDSIGETLWVKMLGGPGEEIGWCVCKTSDSRYMVLGNSNAQGSGGYDLWLILLDKEVASVVENYYVSPNSFSLLQNYPNPFNSSSSIEYSIPKSSRVTLKIFDTLGEEIETLVDEEKPEGTYRLTWNAVNLPSGVYFYQLKAGSFVETKKMILLR